MSANAAGIARPLRGPYLRLVLVKAPLRGLRKASASVQVVLVKAPPRGLRKASEHAPLFFRSLRRVQHY